MKHFLQGKHTSNASPLNPAAPAADSIVNGITQSEETKHQQHIEVVKEGAKVTRIVVTCNCGEVVEIDCLYSAGS